MNKYLTQLCFQIEIEDKQEISFEMQWRFILAESESDAVFAAREIGLKEEQVFLNGKNKNVHWKFISIAEVIEINEANHGVEIISSQVEPIDSNDYLKFIELKSQDLAFRINKKELTFRL